MNVLDKFDTFDTTSDQPSALDIHHSRCIIHNRRFSLDYTRYTVICLKTYGLVSQNGSFRDRTVLFCTLLESADTIPFLSICTFFFTLPPALVCSAYMSQRKQNFVLHPVRMCFYVLAIVNNGGYIGEGVVWLFGCLCFSLLLFAY